MTLDMVDAVGLAAKEEILVDLDPDGDGTPNILTPSEYPPYGGSPPEGVGLVVEGRFRGPDMRDENGFVGRTVKGGPAVAGHHWRDFFLLLPAAPFAAPFKLVTLQHGLDSHKESELGLAAQIAQQGHAVACFDFLHHGKGESGGGFAFIQIDSATKTVGNFRQSALDLLSFVAALEKLANDYDLDGDGKDGGDLAPDLDLSSVVLAGHSLGALESAIAASLAPMPRAAGLIAGGGNFRFLFESVLKKRGLYDMVPVEFMLGFSLVASLLMSDADPAAFAQRLMTAPGGSEPCPFLLLVVLEDGTIPEPCAEAFTLAANAPIILPVEVQWPGALLAQAADTTFGTIQMHGTHEFIHSGDEAGKMGRKVLFHYIQSFFESGQPEILWPVE
jgi:pimeloyl-ACP methyl ester carboxylesterase